MLKRICQIKGGAVAKEQVKGVDAQGDGDVSCAVNECCNGVLVHYAQGYVQRLFCGYHIKHGLIGVDDGVGIGHHDMRSPDFIP